MTDWVAPMREAGEVIFPQRLRTKQIVKNALPALIDNSLRMAFDAACILCRSKAAHTTARYRFVAHR
jgi:hypothetical protein